MGADEKDTKLIKVNADKDAVIIFRADGQLETIHPTLKKGEDIPMPSMLALMCTVLLTEENPVIEQIRNMLLVEMKKISDTFVDDHE